MGVPQGSILSVTLFILKINSNADVIASSFEKSLFVDDFSITCSSRNMASIERQLQLCLNKVEKWADENSFKFFKTKSVCMHFCNKRFYLGFYVAFNTVQVISRRVVGRAEETSTYSSLGFCTVNCRPTASNYQLSHLRP